MYVAVIKNKFKCYDKKTNENSITEKYQAPQKLFKGHVHVNIWASICIFKNYKSTAVIKNNKTRW